MLMNMVGLMLVGRLIVFERATGCLAAWFAPRGPACFLINKA
jgi:hypothetical protein